MKEDNKMNISRRGFLKTVALAGAALAMPAGLDKVFAAELRTRQEVYRADSIPVGAADVASFGIVRRLWQNLVATVSPLL